jgi:hypothetical protein
MLIKICVRLGVVGILAREDVKILTVYVDLSVICVVFYLFIFFQHIGALFYDQNYVNLSNL